MGLLLSVLKDSGSVDNFVLSKLTIKLKVASGSPVGKSRASMVTWQPAPQVVGAGRGAANGVADGTNTDAERTTIIARKRTRTDLKLVFIIEPLLL
jgi:hypothetical protein